MGGAGVWYGRSYRWAGRGVVWGQGRDVLYDTCIIIHHLLSWKEVQICGDIKWEVCFIYL